MWKDINGFDDRYEVSDTGEVRNKKRLNILIPKKNKYGYHEISLRKIGDRTKIFFTVHRLVALHFLQQPDETYQVDHIDGNKCNNNVSNLRWVSCITNNLNRKLTAWTTNKTGELYITKYTNGYMLRINRSDYKAKQWFKNIEEAVTERNRCLSEITTPKN